MKTPGERLKEFRLENDMTQETLGKYFGKPKNYIKAREKGHQKITAEFLVVLYQAFGLSPNWVLLGVEPKFLVDTNPEFRYYGDASF